MTHRSRTDGLKEKEHRRTQSRDAVLGLLMAFIPPRNITSASFKTGRRWISAGTDVKRDRLVLSGKGWGLLKSAVKERSLGRNSGPQELLL